MPRRFAWLFGWTLFALLFLTACGARGGGGRRGPNLPPLENWTQAIVLVVLAIALWWGLTKLLRG